MSQVIFQVACAKLTSAIGDEAVGHSNFTSDLREMLDALQAIQPFLEDAEIRLFRDRVASEWLWYVREAAYKIIDMVDELQDKRPAAAATMTRMLPCLAMMKTTMAIKVKETKKLVMWIRTRYPRFDSMEVNTMLRQIMKRRITGSVFEEALVYGRGPDKKRIRAVLLLSPERKIAQEPITILPIYGLPGSGKTTLAQMVFNDTHSLQGYDFRAWVHVSPELDLHAVGGSIIRQLPGAGGEQEDGEMEYMMKRLHELLNGKKMLLVLDDLWENDPIQLQLLKSMLIFLCDKLDVIVTTCNQAIARKICTIEPYWINPLSDASCWEIIKKLIRLEGQDEELEKMGQEIASKCRGLPSAARAYAAMLYSSRDAMKWKKIMEKNFSHSNFITNPTFSFTFETFKLSYMSMPPYLRLCWAYCCEIFPKGHNICKDDLVHQWIALHLTEPSETLSAAQMAEEYITGLLDLSFLQSAKSDYARGKDDKGVILFTMHDLAHDLARRCLECSYCLVTNHHGKIDNVCDADIRAMRCVGCKKVKFRDDSYSSKKSLRVLELKESSVQKLPDSICQLRNLGYLKISEFSELVTLPESFGHLINLLHIDLSGCSGLLYLPESLGKLTRLVHVNLSGCSMLAALPDSFGNLVNLLHIDLSRCHRLSEILEVLWKLRKLVHLDLSSWSCFEGIGKCLAGLTNLEHLNLSNPCCHISQHRSHLQELQHALGKLPKLRYLNLSMCLNPIFYYHQSQKDSLEYIGECVKGLSALEHLDLSHNTFLFDLPKSVAVLSMLHTLNLSGCIRLKRVGEIKSLKFIDLRKCRGLQSFKFMVRVDEDAPYISSTIVQLEGVNCQKLQISCLENVKSRVEAKRIKMTEKQKLEKLKLSWTLDSLRTIEDSALLAELVPPSNLQCLELNGYSGTCLPDYVSDLASLQELKIVSCIRLNSLPDSMQNLTSLKDLCIFGCPDLKMWCELEENKKMLAHIPNKNYEEQASTSRMKIEEDCWSTDEVEAATDSCGQMFS